MSLLCFFLCLVSAFVWNNLFKDVYIENNLGKYSIPQKQREDFFAAQDNKDDVFLWGKGWVGLLIDSL